MSTLKLILGRMTWSAGRDYLLITIGTLLQALSIRLFLVPDHLVNGGISGLAQLINYYIKFPIGVMILIGNIPMLLLGWRTWEVNDSPSAQLMPSLPSRSLRTSWCYFYLPRAHLQICCLTPLMGE